MSVVRGRFSGRLLALITLAVGTMASPEASAQARPHLTPQVTYQRLDSIGRAALTAPDHDQRAYAALTIVMLGAAKKTSDECVRGGRPASEIPYPGIVDRLASIYRQSAELRSLIVERMRLQMECAKASAFLTAVAQEPSPPSEPVPPGVSLVNDNLGGSLQLQAVSELTYLGAEGEAALQRLYAQGTVRAPDARQELETLARQGFRRRPNN
ncbi:MAG TPA: hypothetical protein VGQ17_04285 [Gemmatimonadales bacterium]|jgi:hypothetical protein|nr:hypothetical protein [Gemmatimonadales bacterium]